MTTYSPAVGGYSPAVPTDRNEKQVYDICEARRWSFFHSWASDPFLVVFASEGKLATVINRSTGGKVVGAFPTVSRLGRRSLRNVRVVKHPGPDPVFSTSLWVRAGYSGYKKAFMQFLREVHGCAPGVSLAALGYDVDHLHNRKRTDPDVFIRVEPTPSLPQQRWGTAYERWASHPVFERKRLGTASWPLVLKLSGMQPPSGWGDEPWLSRLQTFIDTNKIEDPGDRAVGFVRADLARVYLPRVSGRDELEAHREALNREEAARHPGVPLWSTLVLDNF